MAQDGYQEETGLIYDPDRDILLPMKDNRQNSGLTKNIGKLREAPVSDSCGPPSFNANDRKILIFAD